MKRTNFVFILFCIGVLLQSCAAPLAVMGVLGYNQMGYTDEMRALPYEERADEWPIEEYGEMLTMEFVHQSEDGINYAYVGEANAIMLSLADDIDPKNLVWDPSMGRIEKGTEENIYYFFIDKPGLDIEIIVTDTVSGYEGYFYCYSDILPMPVAMLKGQTQSRMPAEKFQKQSMLLLEMPAVDYPVLCDCKSFHLIRVGKDGKREELDNRTNGFSEQVKALVAKASAGDIYIFEQISVLCPSYSAPKFIKSVVYTIE